MKKTICTLVLSALAILGSSAFIAINSTGIQGYAGSPGEATCNACHGGGSSPSSTISLSSVPAFTLNDNQQWEYLPDTVYTITVEVEASGFTRYGFASQVLDANHINSGTIQNPGSGVKFLNSGSRRTAVHTTPKINASGKVIFTYKWVAPTAGGGDATIYAIANAVNGNNTTSGDFVLSPVSMNLVEGTPPPPPVDPNPVGLREHSASIDQVAVFPNPAHEFTSISYYLRQSKTVSVALIDIKGNVVKHLYQQEETPGPYTRILNLQGVASGVYFIKVSANGEKMSQKLISIP